MNENQENSVSNKKVSSTAIFIVFVTVILGSLLVYWLVSNIQKMNTPDIQPSPVPTTTQTQTVTTTPFNISEETPEYSLETVVSDLTQPWDMVMLDDGSFVFTEKINRINYYKDGETIFLASPEDTYVRGEGGMMSLAIDPDFENNNYIYLCFNSTRSGSPDVRVVRYKFNTDRVTLTERTDIITGMPSNDSGRHSGCQLAFGPDEVLWVGTGDAAMHQNPQDPTSLGGKVLRVDRNGNGNGVEGNLSSPFDDRIFNYGHRNVQGLGFFHPDAGFDAPGISIEHGSNRDDEVNALIQGNFGWDPLPGYNESVPLTDTDKFPDAIESIWSSGFPTEATSGGVIVQGDQWKSWNQAVMIAVQKNQKVIVLELNKDLSIKKETEILEGEYGRIRTVVQGTDGDLYILTDNGSSQDEIVRLSPQ